MISDRVYSRHKDRIDWLVRWARKVYNPVLEALGLESKRALERAIQQAKYLPFEVSPLDVEWTPRGEWVLRSGLGASASAAG